MIKPLNEMIYKIHSLTKFGNPDIAEEELKKWGYSVIDECTNNFECTMERNEEGESFEYEDYDGHPVHPVLIRASVLRVKEMIL